MKKILLLLLTAASTALAQVIPPGTTVQLVPIAGFSAATAVTSVAGTANQVLVNGGTAAAAGAVTLSTPSAFIAPGSIAATTTVSGTSGTFSTLTSGRVPFASTGGLLIDDSDMTFATDTLTATKGTFGGVTHISNAIAAANSVTSVAGTALTLATGTSGTFLTGASAGAVTVAAQGSNQSINLTPSGTGAVVLTGSGLSTTGILNLPLTGGLAGGIGWGGTTNLYYDGTGFVGLNSTATTGGLSLYTAGVVKADFEFDTTAVYVGSKAALPLLLRTNNATILTLSTTAGTITGGPQSMTLTSGTGNSRTMTLQTTTSGGTATNFLVADATQGITAGSLAGSGSRAVLADANGLLSAPVSDETWKENLRDLPENMGLKTVLALRPLVFNYKDKHRFGAQDYLGFGARATSAILPEVTGRDRDGTFYLTDEKLTAPLVLAVQQQQRMIAALNGGNADWWARIIAGFALALAVMANLRKK